jgi:hypothetical protein
VKCSRTSTPRSNVSNAVVNRCALSREPSLE